MLHSKQRYLFIDFLRFIAVVFMIQGHTFEALLDLKIRSNTLFFVHDFFHGFVAPMFLFASGVAFGIATFKKWEEHVAPTKHVARRIGKFTGLLAIGYALHLPYLSLQKILYNSTDADLAILFQVDALHCIAVTLLLLQAAVFIIRNEKKFVLFAGITGTIIVFLAPVLWRADFRETLPLWFASYLNAANYSWFPLFPWSGYMMYGTVFAWLFINAKEHHQAVQLMQKLVVWGVASFTISLILVSLPFQLYPPHDVWKSNPLIVFARLGFVAVVTSGVFFAEYSMKIKSAIPQIMGRESLFIYVVHLVIVYGSVINLGLKHLFQPTLSVAESLLVFVGVFLVTVSFTYGWHHFKKNYKRSAIAVRFAGAGIFLYFFFTRPW